MLKYLAVTIVIAVVTAIIIDTYTPRHLLRYDEADYVFATEQGLIDNHIDRNALPLADFIAAGTAGGTDSSKRTELSELVRERGDLSFYRHYHGPLYFYWLMLGRTFGMTGEQALRAWSMVLLGVLALLMVAAARGVHGLDVPLALLPAALLLGSSINILAASQITPHALYGVTSLLALVMLARVMRTGERRDWYAAVASLALAFLTIEYALIIAATYAVGLWMSRERIVRGQWVGVLLRSIAVFLAVIAVLWIGGIIKLTLVKNYLFFAYFSIVRGSAYGSSSVLDVWAEHFSNAPVACAVGLVALVVGAVRLRRNPTLLPYLLYPALVLLTLLRNRSLSPTYVASVFPPLFMVAAITLDDLLRGRSRWIAWGATAAVAIASALTMPAPADTVAECGEQLIARVVAAVDALPARDSSLLVPREHLPILHYYHRRERRFTGFAHDLDDSATIRELVRERRVSGAVTYDSTDVLRFGRIFPDAALVSTKPASPSCDLTFSYYLLHSQ